MLSLPPPEHPGRIVTLGTALREGVPRAYAAIFFSNSERLGWWLIAVTMLAPDMGLSGLGGVIVACALGWWIGFDREQLRSGHLLFNSMLACNTAAWLDHGYGFSAGMFLAMWFMSAFGALLLSVALGSFFSRMLGLGAHSLPAVVVSYVLYFLGWALAGPFQLAGAARGAWMDLEMMPPAVRAMCQGFGAMLFMPLGLPGLFVMIGVAAHSRLTVLAGAVGFAAGFAGMRLLGYALEPMSLLWCGFNFLLCGTALSIGYYTASRASLALAAAAAFLCAPVAVALATALRYFELPASALPANLVILSMVYALKQRREAGHLLPNLHPACAPEVSARLRSLDSARFPCLGTPALRLPCDRPRVVTQAFNGKLTHRGPWQHALDFEASAAETIGVGERARLEDFPIYDTPVLAPCDGLVVRVMAGVPDNEPGGNNPDSNWGNFVMIQGDHGVFALLAHLKRDSISAAEGTRVRWGEPLGRCGNSGRSPAPHLHLHAQDTAVIGAPTRPFCLAHYLSQVQGVQGWKYQTAAVPRDGEKVAPCEFNAALFSTFCGWLPGEYRWTVTSDERGTWEETLVVDFDETGCFRVRSRRHEAGFRAFLREGVFFCVDFEGTGDSVAAMLALGLSRVPCITATPSEVTWEDRFSSIHFAPASARWLHDLLDPFTGPTLLAYRLRFGGDGTVKSEYAGATLAEAGAPLTVEVVLAPRQLATSIRVRFPNDRVLRAELAHYQMQPPAG